MTPNWADGSCTCGIAGRWFGISWMSSCKWTAILVLAAATSGCGGRSSPSVVVTISPITATVLLTNTQQFSASVAGNQNTAVTWQVCNAANPADATGKSGSTITLPTGCVTGSATLGNITTSGLYTAPATLPNPNIVSIVATSQAVTTVFAVVNVTIDSGIRVSVSPSTATVGTTEQFQFTSTVTGTPNAAVTWSVNGIVGGSTANGTDFGTIAPGACAATQPPLLPNPNIPPNGPGTSVACYTAPVPPQASGVTITATSVADTTKLGNATVRVPGATDPVLTATNPLFPSSAVEGSVQQDVYINGSGGTFFSTDLVFVNGTIVPSLLLDVNTIRAVIPATFFANTSPSTLTVRVQRQNGGTSQNANFSVVPTRPAIASSSPDSIPLTSPSGTANLIGGYFSSSSVATVQGSSRVANIQNSRQLSVTLLGSDFSTPGLLPILIQNSDVPSGLPAIASFNVAVPPAASSLSTAPTSIAVGTTPDAVAIDPALGIAVVVNQGASGSPGSVSLINLDANPPALIGSAITVGNVPTSAAVDDQLHLAAVVNSADNTVSIVNLQSASVISTLPLPTNPTATSPAPSTPIPPPFSIGVNPLTHRALVAYSLTNIATVVDLSTNQVVCILGGSNPSISPNCSTIPLTNTRSVSTGINPQVAVDPQLNWAVVTPGGAGAISLVDLGTPASASQVERRPNVIATMTLTSTIQGIAIDAERHQALFTDPRQSLLTLFSTLDQTTNGIGLDSGEVASAINPLTNVGVVVNRVAGTATVVDLQTRQKIAPAINVGSLPGAVAIDPGKNVAVITNQGDNTVSVLPLGPILSPQITEISSPTTFSVPPSSPGTFTLTATGFGFASGAVVRLDGSSTGITTTVAANGRQVTASIPNSMLTAPRRFALDVMNPGGTTSNEENFTVIGAVPVGQNPIGVAIDPTLNEAVVTVQGSINPSTGACSGPGTASLVNMATVAILNTFPVGTCPEGVAVDPRLGRAVVANNGSNDATVIDYVNNTGSSTVNVRSSPMGVAIQPDTSTAAIANFNDNTVSLFSIAGAPGAASSSIPVDQGPVGLSVDLDDGLLAVTAATQGTVDIVNMSSHFIVGRLFNFSTPTDASFDPITGNFLVANSLANNIGVVDPVTFGAIPISSGINPTAIAYNFQSSTAVTVNRATNTMSVLDFQATNTNGVLTFTGRQVREILPMGGSDEFSVAINQETNVAAVVDQANGRLLLVPLPR